MIKQFERLAEEERQLLFKAPELISMLGSGTTNEVNKGQKADAINSTLKNFYSFPVIASVLY